MFVTFIDFFTTILFYIIDTIKKLNKKYIIIDKIRFTKIFYLPSNKLKLFANKQRVRITFESLS